MRRSLVVVVALLALSAPLAGVAGGLSSTPTQSADLDVVYIDGSNNLKYVDAAGNIVDTGVQAADVGGAADFDDDGEVEVAFIDTGSTPSLKYTDANGTVTNLAASGPLGSVGGVGDWDDDGDPDVLFSDNGELRYVDDDGNNNAVGEFAFDDPRVDNVNDVGDVADIDGDGNLEVAVATTGDDLIYAEGGADTTTVVSGGVGRTGAAADLDDDNTVEIVYDTGDIAVAEPDGTTTDTGISGDQIGGAGDIDIDGDVEFATGAFDLLAGDINGGTTTLAGVAPTRVGAMVDFDDDGSYDEPPTASDASPSSTTVSSDPVTLSVDVTDSEFVIGDSATVDIDHNGNDIQETTISSNQTVTADVQDVSDGSNSWSVTVTDSEGNSNSYSYSYTADYAAPQLSNAQPTGNASSYGGEVSVEISDADFDNNANDVVTVTASESGAQIGSTKVSSNTTVSFDYNAVSGSQTVDWTATDSHGNTDTLSQQFTVQSDLIIRNESNTNQLVASPTVVEATFFGENQTVTKSDNDGTISFDGLPADQPFIVEVSADNYRDRTIYVPSLLQQQTVYLLPENASAVQVRFRLEDASGTFDERSVLYIEKPINDSGNVSYQIIVSDRFGAAGVTTFLEKNVRYDLRAVSERGDVAQIGSYGAAVNETVVLEPSVASIQDPEDSDAIQYEARYRNSTQEILIEYVDPAGRTDEVTVRVVKQNGTVIKPNQTYYSSQTLSLSVSTNGQLNQTAYVYLNGTRGNETFGARIPVGPQQQDITPADLGGVWVQIGAGAVILMVGGVFSALNVAAGAVITSLFAGVLWWLGIMSGLASGAAIALAIGLSTLNLLLNR